MLSPYSGPLAWAVGDCTTVASSSAATSLLTAAAASGKWAMPGGFFTYVGQMIRVRAAGRLSTASSAGTLIFTFVIGAVAVATSPTFSSQNSQTNLTWTLDWVLTLRAVGDGTLANFMHTGNFVSQLVSSTNLNNLIPTTAPAVGTGFNSSVGATVDLQSQWGNANANSILLSQYMLESLN